MVEDSLNFEQTLFIVQLKVVHVSTVKNTANLKVTGNFLTCPDQDINPDSGERQQVVIESNAYDKSACEARVSHACRLFPIITFTSL